MPRADRRCGRCRPLPRAQHAPGAGRRDELVLPPLPLCGPSAAVDPFRRTGSPPATVRRRGALLPRHRTRRHQRVPSGGSGPRLGHSGTGRPDAGRLRVVRCPRQLPQRPRVRRPRQCCLPALVAAGRPASTRDRQRHPAVPRRVLAGVPRLGTPAAADPRRGPPIPHRRRSEDLQVGGHDDQPVHRSSIDGVPTPCGGGSPAT